MPLAEDIRRTTQTGAWSSSMLNHALLYAEKFGWPVFPVWWPNEDGTCACGDVKCTRQGKHPLIAGGRNSASLDRDQIENWFEQWPLCNIGIPTGEESGLCILDTDGQVGRNSYKSLENTVPFTVTAKTGNGVHYFFKHPSSKIKTKSKVYPGIDSRGDGGYILICPSLHYSGRRYTWLENPISVEIAECPEWWFDIVNGPEIEYEPQEKFFEVKLEGDTEKIEAYAQKAFKEEICKIYSAGPHKRNQALNDAAYYLYQFVAGGSLDEQMVTNALYDAARAINRTPKEAKWTINSGRRAGFRKPRYIPELKKEMDFGNLKEPVEEEYDFWKK